MLNFFSFFFFFNDTATTEIYTLSLHDALRDLVGEEHPVRAALARSRFACAPRDPAVDDEVRDVDALGRQLPRHALREAAQRELPHRERRRFGVALDARGRAREE